MHSCRSVCLVPTWCLQVILIDNFKRRLVFAAMSSMCFVIDSVGFSCLHSALAYTGCRTSIGYAVACALCMFAVVDQSTRSSVWRAVCTCLGGTSQCH